MAKRDAYGEVHAPVEDTDVPFTLQLLVVIIIILIIGIGALVGITISQSGPIL
jgi:hypothetical protein